jgi:RNA polymerase sigma-70 factor (ECF subfamily)
VADESAGEPISQAVTRMLREWRNGDLKARDQLVSVVYDQLHSMARRCFYSEAAGHTLRPTALVHEAYLRLAEAEIPWNDRAHFYAIAAQTMRRILVDHARSHHRRKRGGSAEHVALEDVVLVSPEPSEQIIELDDALARLTEMDERKGRIIELLYFGGLTYDEAAATLEVSPATLHRDLKLARAWLTHEMRRT